MRVKLGDVCDIQTGGTPSRSNHSFWENGSIPWVKISDIENKFLNSTEEKITQLGLKNSSAKLFKKGTVLYSIFASLGETCILNIDAATNQAIAGVNITDKNVLETDYLYYFLKSQKNYVINLGRGVAQNNINLKILRNFEINVPSIEIQKKIVKTLSKLDLVERKLKNFLNFLDLIVKSR